MFISRPSCNSHGQSEVFEMLDWYIGFINFDSTEKNIKAINSRVVNQRSISITVHLIGDKWGIDIHLLGNFSLTS